MVCAIAALSSAGISQAAPLLAVDLGGEFLKVSLVRAGSGFSVVINEMSKRRTAAQVSLVGGERLLGEDAAALAPRHPEQVFARCDQQLNCGEAEHSLWLQQDRAGPPQQTVLFGL